MSKKSDILTNPWVLLIGGIAVGTGVFFGGKAIQKNIKQKREKGAGDQVDSKDNTKAMATTFAQQLRSAFNPSGQDWMRSFDTTNLTAVFDVAKKMYQNKVPFSAVSTAYNNLYQASFVSHLQDELNSSEVEKFYSILKTGLGSVALPPASTLIGI